MEEVEIGVGTEELMAGSSKGVKVDRPSVNPNAEPPVVTTDSQTTEKEDRIDLPMIGYKHRRRGTQLSTSAGLPMIGYIDSNEDLPEDADNHQGNDEDSHEPNKDVEDCPRKTKRQKTVGNEVFRNRGSPARLYKLNKSLIPVQKGVIISKEFGGLLDLGASTMDADLSQWIMKHYDPEMSQIVIPNRGKIPVDAASVHRIWGLPNRGTKVCFENRPEITKAIYSIYNITSKSSPSLTEWCKMIGDMHGTYDDDFLRAWLAVAFSCFLAPTTSLNISPKSFPAVMDVNGITKTNVCQFVVDQLKAAFTVAGVKKNVVCCCVFHLVLLYLDSLDVDEPIPSLRPRVSVWNSDLIAKVVKKDKKGPGQYGKLRLKTEFSRCADDSLFGSMDHVTKFVAAKLPDSYNKENQKKLSALVHEMCSEFSHSVGKFVYGIGRIDDDEAGTSRAEPTKLGTSRQKSNKRSRKELLSDSESVQSEEGSDSIPSGVESYKSDSGESDDDADKTESDSDGYSDYNDDDQFRREHAGRNSSEKAGTTELEQDVQVDRDDIAGNNVEVQPTVTVASTVEQEEDEGEKTDEEKESEEKEVDEDNGEDDDNDDDADDDMDKGGDKEEDKEEDGKGDGKFDEDGSGGNNNGHGDGGGNSGNNDGADGNTDSDDDEECTLQYLLQKKDCTSKNLDDYCPINMRDVVMLEQENRLPAIPLLEANEVHDWPSAACEARKAFGELLMRLPTMEVSTMNLEEICPKSLRKIMMKELGAMHDLGEKTKKVVESKLPPLPSKKKKNVSFILEPTVVTATVEELHERRAKNNLQGQGVKQRQPAIKKSQHFELQKQATPAIKEASSVFHKNQVEVNAATSTETTSDGLRSVKGAVDGVPTVPVQSHVQNSQSICQAIVTESLANQPNKEANYKNGQSNLAPGNVDATRPAIAEVAAQMSENTEEFCSRQPFAEINGQAQMHTHPNVAKEHKLKARAQCILLDARQNKNQENTLFSDDATLPDDNSVKSTNPEVKLLQSLSKLPATSTCVAQISQTVNPKGKRSNLCDGNKENRQPLHFKENTRNALEINVLDISELIARCAPPNNKSAESSCSKSAILLPSQTDGRQIHQIDSTAPDNFIREYCPAPSFSLGLDDVFSPEFPVEAAQEGDGPSTLPDREFIQILDDSDDWDLGAGIEACQELNEGSKELVGVCALANQLQDVLSTPEKCSNQVKEGSGSKYYSSSSSGEPVTHQFDRRIIKPPHCMRSPFMDYNERKSFQCKPDVNRLYASVILHGRLNEEASPEVDTSPRLIDYRGYYVTVRELVNSMKKEGFLLSHVVEIGIQSIVMNLPPDSKKVVMPLRFSSWLLQIILDKKEVVARFNKSNRLDRKDMITFIVLENIDESKPVTGNHYWVFNVNLRDRRFEVLDSWRTLENKALDNCARRMVASVRSLWETHYLKSHISMDDFKLVNIDVPQQNNKFDRGVYALTLTTGWVARIIPRITSDDIPNIGKQLTSNWVNTEYNKAPWKDILKLP